MPRAGLKRDSGIGGGNVCVYPLNHSETFLAALQVILWIALIDVIVDTKYRNSCGKCAIGCGDLTRLCKKIGYDSGVTARQRRKVWADERAKSNEGGDLMSTINYGNVAKVAAMAYRMGVITQTGTVIGGVEFSLTDNGWLSDSYVYMHLPDYPVSLSRAFSVPSLHSPDDVENLFLVNMNIMLEGRG